MFRSVYFTGAILSLVVPTAVLAQTLAPGPAIYQQDFSKSTSDFGVGPTNTGHSEVANGALHITAKKGLALESINTAEKITDGTLTADVTFVSGNKEGNAGNVIFWQSQNLNQYYEFCLSVPDGYRLFKKRAEAAESDPLTDWLECSAIHAGVGQTNRVSVSLNGRHASFFVNDQFLGTTFGDPPEGGSFFGFQAVGSPTLSCEIAVDNVKITKPISLPKPPVLPPKPPVAPPVGPPKPPVEPPKPPVAPVLPPKPPVAPPVGPPKPPVAPVLPPKPPVGPPKPPVVPPKPPVTLPVLPTKPPVGPTKPPGALPVLPTKPSMEPTKPPASQTPPSQ
ncbi:MAG: hypothetical protein ACRD3W_25950 [Terriglobales bacterium]